MTHAVLDELSEKVQFNTACIAVTEYHQYNQL